LVSRTNHNGRLGLWLVGAFGGVGTTIAVGVSALSRGLTKPVGLATALENFKGLPFASFDEFVLGGHDVRKTDYVSSSQELRRTTNVFNPELLAACSPDLADWTENVRPGLVRHSGEPVEAFADWRGPGPNASPREQIDLLAADIREFAKRNELRHVVVLNIASSEPMPKQRQELESWDALEKALRTDRSFGLPASSLYGLAAVEAGASYINFTPSFGLGAPALEQRAKDLGALYMGKDGKTGETLMKAVLAPMFARRNLSVLSWVGHNILGNRDGLVLQDPVNKQGKMESKDRLLAEILGYEPQTLVTIEYIASLGDRKTAWDHIHFEGFLGTQMTLQFIWQGCDSLLAAPLALDLVLWTDLAWKRGEKGCLEHLASYFKSPMHSREHDFFRQWSALESYVRTCQLDGP
jgi:myo-inositol-1-phosphate synthase